MDRRLLGCGWAALMLHGSLVALGATRPEPPPAARASAAETDVDLVPLAPVEPASVEPPPLSEPPSRRDAVAVARRLGGRVPRRAPPGDVPAGAEPQRAAPEPGPSRDPAQSAGEPTPAGKRLSLGDLGLTGTSSALLPPPPDGTTGRVDPDVGGLKRALRARDTELGLGPGGAVAARIRPAAQDLAPLGSEATLSVDLASDGSIETIFLDGSTSNEGEWRQVIRDVRARAGKQFVAKGPVRVTVLVTCRSAKRAGGSGGPLSFDVSNIGSPTMRWLHIRVLRQEPL